MGSHNRSRDYGGKVLSFNNKCPVSSHIIINECKSQENLKIRTPCLK